MATIIQPAPAPTSTDDFLPLLGTDYIELYVGNAKQAAHYYKTAFGFQSLAYSGLETGVRHKVSYVLQQGKIRLALGSDPVRRWPTRHCARGQLHPKPLGPIRHVRQHVGMGNYHWTYHVM